MKKRAGRPRKIDENLLKKLEQGFMYGFTDQECCLYADISPQTLYNYCKENPEFLERKEILKNRPKIRAKLNVAKAMEREDLDTSKWYLERKAKNEFSTKTDNEVFGNFSLNIQDKRTAVDEVMKDLLGDE